MRRKWFLLAPLALMGFAMFIALGGWIVMLLWNQLLPPLFSWHAVTFWQALGLLVLCRILFGGLGLHQGARSRLRGGMGARSPEEREHFRERLRDRFGFGPPAGESKRP